MIVCKACGSRNADRDEFCNSCGRYLAWSGEHVDDPVEEAELEAEPEAVAVAARRPGFVERVRTAIGVPPRHPGEQVPAAPTAVEPGGQAPHGGEAPHGEVGNGVSSPGTEPPEPPDPDASSSVKILPGAPAGKEPVDAPGGAQAPATAADAGGTGAAPVSENGAAVHEAPDPLLDTAVVPVVPAVGPGDPAVEGDVGAAALVTVSSSVPASAEVPAVTPRRPGDPVALVVPVDAPEESPGEPPAAGERGSVLRRPTEVETTSRVRKRTVAVELPHGPTGPAPGDVICHHCNQFNSPDRTYCRRCGEELHPELAPGEAPKYVYLDFWQRHVHRDVEITSAGNRPGRWGRAVSGGGGQGMWVRVATRALGGLAAVLLVLSFIGPTAQPIRNWFTNTYDSLVHKVDITYTQVFAIGGQATSQISAHPASYAVDDGTNTYWQAKPTPHDGAGQAIVAVFAQPTNIDRVGILSGAGPSQQDFLKETAPKEVELVFTGRNEHYEIREHLQDSHTFQRLDVKAKNATSMTMRILSVYPSPLKSKSVAVTEVEFFQRT